MPNIDVNGETIDYPDVGDPNWGDNATNFAIQTSAALGKIGLSSGTSVDITQTLDVTGNTTLDANLSVGGNANVTGNTTLTGNLTVNGNTQLGNANTDTIGVTGIVNVDSGVLYVDPVNNRVGINDTTPSQALDVTGDVAITGNETVGGTLGVTGDFSINTNKFNVTATNGNTAISGTLGVTGNANLSASLLNSDGSVSSPSVSFTNNTNAGLYRIGANNLGVSISGTKVSDISNLGILNGTLGTDLRNVLQIVQGQTDMTYSTAWTQTSNTNYWLLLQGTITPKSSSSKIIITGNHCVYATSATTANQNLFTAYKTSSYGTVRTDLGATLPTGIIDRFLGALSNAGTSASFNNFPIISIISGLTAGTTYYISLISQTSLAAALQHNRDNTKSTLVFTEAI